MTAESERFRAIETAPEWIHEVFDTFAELTELLETHSYRFARTMPGAPHSYTLKRTWPSEDEFVAALRKMRAVERIEEFFRGDWYRRFNANLAIFSLISERKTTASRAQLICGR